MSYIMIKNLNQYYGEGVARKQVLCNLSLNIEKGEMLSIMGASGSGKSTLLNILGLLKSADDGEYMWNDVNMRGQKEKEQAYFRNRNIGFVFQNFNLVHELNALENVKLAMQFSNLHVGKKYSRSEMDKRSKEVLCSMGLKEHMMKYPSQLSGGQQQRVAIARAIVNEPELLLADEPTGALDSKTTEEIMDVLKELNQQGITMVLVTHNSEVADYCNRRLYMQDGCIYENGQY